MKKKSLLLLVLSVTMVLSMLANPLYAAAQTPPSGAGIPTGNSDTTGSPSFVQALGFKSPPLQQSPPNPFGTTDKTLLEHTSIAMAGVYNNFGIYDYNFGIYDAEEANFTWASHAFARDVQNPKDWITLPKVMTAANVTGTSRYQQVLTAFLAPDGSSYDLYLSIEDYNAGSTINGTNVVQPKSYFIPLGVKDITMTGLDTQHYKSHFQIVAAEGRVAILVNNTIYDYRLSYDAASGYTAALVRTGTFGTANFSLIDLKAGDLTGNGMQDLVVVTSPPLPGMVDDEIVKIYTWEQSNDSSFDNPMVTLDAGYLFGGAAAVGNVTGNGTALLVSGYSYIQAWDYPLTFEYVTWDAQKAQFIKSSPITAPGQPDTSQDQVMVNQSDVPDLALVSFAPPNPGEPQYVFYDGWVYQYDTNAPLSAERFVTKFSTLSDSFESYFDTAIGNLVNPSPDQPPAQQLAVLAEDQSSGKINTVYWYSLNNNTIGVSQGSVGNTQYPAMSGAVVKGTVFSLKYQNYTFTMTDPKVVAVLGASPYYQELLSTTGNGQGNESTTFGTSQTVEQETSNSLNVTAGVFGGVDVELEAGVVVSVKVAELEATFDITGEFTKQWSHSTSVTTSQSYSAVGNDMVVVTSTPYDVFTYQISDPGNKDDGQYYSVGVPRQPVTELMNLSAYNTAVAEYNANNPKSPEIQIPPGVLDHTVGDPRTYVSAHGTDNSTVTRTLSDNILGIESATVALNGSFVGAGVGDGLSEETIATGDSLASSYGGGLSYTDTVKAVAGVIEIGGHQSIGWSHDTTDSIGKDTEISGSVFNVPDEDELYDFQWQLVGYKDMVAGDEFYVVNYVVNWNGRTPPPPPVNLQLINYGSGPNGGKTATIGWENNESNVSKYLIYRGTSRNVDTTTPYFTGDPTKFHSYNNPTYTDSNLSVGQQYYYEVVTEVTQSGGSTEDSPPSAPLAVPELITGLSVTTQPKLDYVEGDQLDLSALVVTATMADGSEEDLTFNDLLQRGMYFNISDGTELSSADNGVAVSITDPATGTSAGTNQLNVSPAASPSSLEITTSFTVGGVTNATALAAGKTLTADFAITNNEASPQSVIAVVALFDPNGSMTNVAYSSQQVGDGKTITFTEGGFTLPWQVTGYAARAFILEGTQFSTASLRPLSDIAQISS